MYLQSSKPTVLVVDDDDAIRKVLVTYFTHKGFRVLEAANGEDSMSLFTKHMPQIVLLDILMPGFNGLEMLEMYRKIYPNLKVIMISSIQDEKIFRKCIEMGAVDYMTKPIDLINLDSCVMSKILM